MISCFNTEVFNWMLYLWFSMFLFTQGRLNELMSQIRMQNHFGAVRSEERYSVDADLLREIKQVRESDFNLCFQVNIL